MADSPLGRSGRGALLRAALLQQQRRPVGGEEEKKEKEKPLNKLALGRAALLSQFQNKAAASQGQQIINSLGRSSPLPRPRNPTPSSSSPSPPCSNQHSTRSNSPDSSLHGMRDLNIKEEKPTIIKMGNAGKKVEVACNYIRLVKTSSDRNPFVHHVTFTPNVDSKNIRFKLLHQLTETIGKVRIFDGAKLYLPYKFPNKETIFTAVRPTDEANITIKIKLVGTGFTQSHLYNVLIKRINRFLNLARIGQNDYDPKGGIEIPQHRLEVWPGYVTAVSDYEGGVMLNCDASFRVLRNVTAHDVLSQCAERNSSQFKDEVFRQLIGCIVLTRYNNKTYRIDDIDWDQNPASTFSTCNGGVTSFLEYYKKSYDITIDDMQQPLLVNRPKKSAQGEGGKLVCLVPELCHLTGLTDELRNDFRVMKDIATHTRILPGQRQACLRKYRDNIMNNPDCKQTLDDWGLALDSVNIDLEARLMPMEKIIFKDKTAEAGGEANWQRACINNKVISAVNMTDWILICTQKNQAQVNDFIQRLKAIGNSFGMKIVAPSLKLLSSDRTEEYVSCARHSISHSTQMIVFVFPTSRDDRYSAVKKLCCVEVPVPSQVIIAKTILPRKLTSVTQKIALQMNCKLGGELWAVPIPLKQLMICGVDVYHDAKSRGRSVVGFTASLNHLATRWFSNVHFQNAGEELVNSLKFFLVAACRKYHNVNNELPQKIVLYRDGVGDGQLNHVAEHEIPQIVDSLKCFGSDYKPTLTVVIVQKRINTRIFLKTNGSVENPYPGTVLDHTVTRKHWYDFFLVSQHVRQGTVTPTHYIVVYDSSSLLPDHLQRLTYKMTHLYYNWAGTIRCPAPCQYAHKLAYLVGQNINKEPSAELSDRLYYL